MGFPRQEHWSGLPFPSPGELPHPGSKSEYPALTGIFFTTEPPIDSPKNCAGVHAKSLQSCRTLCNTMDCTIVPARLLCPWDSPGKNTGVGCHAFLQGIFLIQGSETWSGSPALQADSLPFESLGVCWHFKLMPWNNIYLICGNVCKYLNCFKFACVRMHDVLKNLYWLNLVFKYKII